MMIVRQPTGQEIARVEELMAIAFETPLDRTAEKRPWPDNAHPWAAYCPETGEMMSALLVTEFNVRFDGCACKMGGRGRRGHTAPVPPPGRDTGMLCRRTAPDV